jgi:hypothetical protein
VGVIYGNFSQLTGERGRVRGISGNPGGILDDEMIYVNDVRNE